jgi:outer membrane protein OmpA-like peptidoglycan-associated protein
MSKTQRGALLGGATGAAAGAAVSDDDTKGAVVGGVAGALVGGLIGSYLDDQAEELEEIDGATVERVGDEVRVTFDSAILFDFDSAALRGVSKTRLDQMAEVLVKYPETDILVLGHTDSQGDAAYNMKLSERRSDAVGGYLGQKGVAVSRVRAKGFGETVPVADNGTETGRAQNRRVEVSIQVNDEFRARAEQEG